MFVGSLIIASIFLVVYYKTVNESAAWTYLILEMVWGSLMVLVALVFGKRPGGLPFNFLRNISGWQYLLGFLAVPIMFFLALGIEILTGNSVQITSVVPTSSVPEVLSKFFPHFAFLDTSQIPVWAQTIGWHFGDVSPGETEFQVGAIIGLCLAVFALYKRNRRKKGLEVKELEHEKWISLGIMTGVNLLWTSMHGILGEYTTLPQFAIAFLAGEVLLSLFWILENPLPTVTGHALWNVLGTFGLLTVLNMTVLGFAVLITILALYLLKKRRKRSK